MAHEIPIDRYRKSGLKYLPNWLWTRGGKSLLGKTGCGLGRKCPLCRNEAEAAVQVSIRWEFASTTERQTVWKTGVHAG